MKPKEPSWYDQEMDKQREILETAPDPYTAIDRLLYPGSVLNNVRALRAVLAIAVDLRDRLARIEAKLDEPNGTVVFVTEPDKE